MLVSEKIFLNSKVPCQLVFFHLVEHYISLAYNNFIYISNKLLYIVEKQRRIILCIYKHKYIFHVSLCTHQSYYRTTKSWKDFSIMLISFQLKSGLVAKVFVSTFLLTEWFHQSVCLSNENNITHDEPAQAWKCKLLQCKTHIH